MSRSLKTLVLAAMLLAAVSGASAGLPQQGSIGGRPASRRGDGDARSQSPARRASPRPPASIPAAPARWAGADPAVAPPPGRRRASPTSPHRPTPPFSGAAQSCISVAGKLLNICEREIAVGTIVYPLTSEAAPNEDQVVAIKFGAAYARPALPTEDCCAAAKSALETNCQCDQNLPALAATLGIDATQVGLEGAINQCALMCGLGTVEC